MIAWAWMDGEWTTPCLMPTGKRIGHSFCYRDARNVPAMEKTFSMVPQERLYEITGIQFLPFNTIYQLVAHVAEFPEEWDRAARWLTLPEYFQYRLTGVAAAEYTEASTTQLLDVRTRSWSQELTSALGLSLEKFPPIVQAGTVLGKLRPEVSEEVGLADTQVIAPACHDTGSAVAGIPFPHEGLAFISSGTWSLVGTVLLEPVVSGGGTREGRLPMKVAWRAASGSSRTSLACGFFRNACANGRARVCT